MVKDDHKFLFLPPPPSKNCDYRYVILYCFMQSWVLNRNLYLLDPHSTICTISPGQNLNFLKKKIHHTLLVGHLELAQKLQTCFHSVGTYNVHHWGLGRKGKIDTNGCNQCWIQYGTCHERCTHWCNGSLTVNKGNQLLSN